MNYTYTDELYHHGIKGQKWGVRRFQNEDGSLTAAGKARYASGSLTGKMHANLSKQYQEGFHVSKEKADEAAAKDIEFAKKAAIAAAAVTLTAAGIYAYRKYGMEYADEIIKSGTTIQTVTMDANRLTNGKAFYTAYTESDKQIYAGMFGTDGPELVMPGLNIKIGGGNKYKVQATVEKGIKIASIKSSERAFNDLMKNDAEFKSFVDNKIKGSAGLNGAKTDYEKFNAKTLLVNDARSMEMQKKFYSELSKRGYQGVADVNDRKYSGFNTKAAIIFDNDNFKKNAQGVMDVKAKRLSDTEIEAGKKHYINKSFALAFTTPSMFPAYVAAGATALHVSNTKKKLAKSARKEAKQYLKDHPESNMSLSEAEKMISKRG